MSRFSVLFLKIIPCIMLMLLAGCSSYPRVVETWPENIPDIGLFISSYEQDPDNQEDQSMENYLTWVKRFYNGWVVYDMGWLDMSADIESRMNNEEQAALAAERVADIGLLIAPEWAKNKPDRYITTSMVSIWGESLLEALDRDEVFDYIDKVEADLALLKTGAIGSESISMDRYFPDLARSDEDFFF